MRLESEHVSTRARLRTVLQAVTRRVAWEVARAAVLLMEGMHVREKWMDLDALARIDEIPASVLPEGDARWKLEGLALVEHPIDIYRERGRWIIWSRPAHPWQDGRFTIERWLHEYAAEHERVMHEGRAELSALNPLEAQDVTIVYEPDDAGDADDDWLDEEDTGAEPL